MGGTKKRLGTCNVVLGLAYLTSKCIQLRVLDMDDADGVRAPEYLFSILLYSPLRNLCSVPLLQHPKQDTSHTWYLGSPVWICTYPGPVCITKAGSIYVG